MPGTGELLGERTASLQGETHLFAIVTYVGVTSPQVLSIH